MPAAERNGLDGVPAAGSRSGPDKLSIVVFSGDFDRIHYALVMAAGAAASNTPVTLFFTMWASRALGKALPDGSPGWTLLKCSDGRTARRLNDGFKTQGLGHFEELLEACVALGVTFMVCEMGMKALGIEASGLRPDVPVTTGGVVTFLADASATGGMLFI